MIAHSSSSDLSTSLRRTFVFNHEHIRYIKQLMPSIDPIRTTHQKLFIFQEAGVLHAQV